MVREVIVGKDGLAKGVSYVSKDDMMEYQVNGDTVILAASACGSARILLNSKSATIRMGWPIAVVLSGNIYMILQAQYVWLSAPAGGSKKI